METTVIPGDKQILSKEQLLDTNHKQEKYMDEKSNKWTPECKWNQ